MKSKGIDPHRLYRSLPPIHKAFFKFLVRDLIRVRSKIETQGEYSLDIPKGYYIDLVPLGLILGSVCTVKSLTNVQREPGSEYISHFRIKFDKKSLKLGINFDKCYFCECDGNFDRRRLSMCPKHYIQDTQDNMDILEMDIALENMSVDEFKKFTNMPMI